MEKNDSQQQNTRHKNMVLLALLLGFGLLLFALSFVKFGETVNAAL